VAEDGSCAPAKGANTTLGKPTYQHKHSRRSPSRGHLRFGDSIWSGPSGKLQGATRICLSLLTSS
jgi:hypothetical protein